MALVHCRECGEMIAESAPTCPKCGARQLVSNPTISTNSEEVDLDPSVGLNVISFLWPFVGLVLYFIYLDKSPRRAKACGKWALIGFILEAIVCIIIVVAYFIFLIGMIPTILNY